MDDLEARIDRAKRFATEVEESLRSPQYGLQDVTTARDRNRFAPQYQIPGNPFTTQADYQARSEKNTAGGYLGLKSSPVAFTQTYSTADATLSAYTSDPESVAYTGAADGEAKLTDLNQLRVAYDTLRVFTEDLAAFCNSLVDELQAQKVIG